MLPVVFISAGVGAFEALRRRAAGPMRALHCFQKKSPSGIRTARPDTELIERRLRLAEKEHEVRYGR